MVLRDAGQVPGAQQRADQLQTAIDAFAVLGADALQELTPLLADDQDSVRIAAAVSLQRIGAPAAPAAPELIPLLRDRTNIHIKIAALRAAAAMGREAFALQPEVTALLEDREASVRIEAVRASAALDRIEEGTPLHDRLSQIAVRDLDGFVRQEARRALQHERFVLPDEVSPVRD